jgi:cephalosporin hydroxylase
MGVENLRSVALVTEGSVTDEEGEKLKALAMHVPKGRHIVELGSYRGRSAVWLVRGANEGEHAPVVTVDSYEGPTGAEDLLAFNNEMSYVEHHLRYGVSQIIATAQEAGREWGGPVGLLFHDANHDMDVVEGDLRVWEHFVAPGGWFAVHDYYGSNCVDGEWVRTDITQRAVDTVLLARGVWDSLEVIDNLWVGRRLSR